MYTMSYYVQSVLIPRRKQGVGYSLTSAKSWIKAHGFKLKWQGKPVDVKPDHYRFRQRSPHPRQFYRAVTKTLPKSGGVQLIIYYLGQS